MAKTRIEKIAGIDEEIAQLLAAKKNLLQEQKEVDRKERTNRLCKRAGHLESLLPDSIRLTNERFNEFLAKTVVTDEAKRILKNLLDEQALEAEIAAEETMKTQTAGPDEKTSENTADTVQAPCPADAANSTNTAQAPRPANSENSTDTSQATRPPNTVNPADIAQAPRPANATNPANNAQTQRPANAANPANTTQTPRPTSGANANKHTS